MKKTVLDMQDLQAISPFFKNKAAIAIMKKMFKWCSVDKVNQVHSNHCHLRGSEFTSALLADPLIDVKYRVHHEERLDTLPEGAFVTVSNHPIGSLDGIMLIDIFASRRKDFCVMTNNALMKIGAMADNFIPIKPNTSKDAPVVGQNINGVRASIARLKDGHPMGFFPAGAMSFYDKEKKVRDLPWTHSVIRLIRKTKVPVYPVFFDCRNSHFFYWLGNISWKLRTFRIPTEAFNKQGQTLDIYIGERIAPHTIQQYPDDIELANFLYHTTYGLKELG